MRDELTIEAPVKDRSVLEKLRTGDVIYLSGLVATARDEAYRRIALMNEEPPLSLEGWAIFHAGPIMKRVNNEWQCLSIGPTTSIRLESYSPSFIERTGVSIIIGKGGMGRRTAEACRKHRAIYTVFPGGCGVLGASFVKEVIDVKWLELGIPEAMWILRVERLGPLIVTIDATGRNLAEEVKSEAKSRMNEALSTIREGLTKKRMHEEKP